jgi:hypothetical protein
VRARGNLGRDVAAGARQQLPQRRLGVALQAGAAEAEGARFDWQRGTSAIARAQG